MKPTVVLLGLLLISASASANIRPFRPLTEAKPVTQSQQKQIRQRALEKAQAMKRDGQDGIRCGNPIPSKATYRGVVVPAGSRFCEYQNKTGIRFPVPVQVGTQWVQEWWF